MEGKNRIINERIILRETQKMKNMKRLITLSLIILSLQNFAQVKQLTEVPKVDRRIELLSIVFRLAGNKEYNATFFKKYTDKVESHFMPNKEHEIIQFARELRVNKRISYDAVMSMAIMLDKDLNPLIDFSITQPERWSKDDAIKFVKLLKKFYKDAKCKEFFNDNEALFQEVETRFRPVYDKLDLNWYHSFYGEKGNENFTIIVSIGCGTQNYGPSYMLPNSEKKAFAILGTWKVDESGMPVYNQSEYLPTILHEFNHSYVNPLLAKHNESFEESGKEIYKVVEHEMSQQAYSNWQIMLNEALVRASVIKYFIDHGASESEIQMMLNNEINKGFLWMNGLVDELKKYGNQRNNYPTLESYIPNLSHAYKTFDVQRPKVESITEFANNDTNVSPQLKTITINFDKTLSGNGYSMNYGKQGQQTFPKMGKVYFTNNNMSVVIEVQLIPNQEYQFVLTDKRFKTPAGIGLETYEVNFKTL